MRPFPDLEDISLVNRRILLAGRQLLRALHLRVEYSFVRGIYAHEVPGPLAVLRRTHISLLLGHRNWSNGLLHLLLLLQLLLCFVCAGCESAVSIAWLNRYNDLLSLLSTALFNHTVRIQHLLVAVVIWR